MRGTQDIVLARLREVGRRWRAELGLAEPEVQPGRPPTPWGRVLGVLGVGALLLTGAVLLLRAPRAADPAPAAAFAGSHESRSGSAGETATPAPTDRPDSGEREAAGVLSDPFAESPSPSALTVVVHVAGEVRRPGIVTLPAGARVADAVQASGGLKRGGSLGGVNLARPVVDGERIEVGADVPADAAAQTGAAEGAARGGSGASGGVLDLNTATPEQLDALPGVGPVTASKILAWREEHGRFTVVDELAEVSGIGPKTLEEIRPHVRV